MVTGARDRERPRHEYQGLSDPIIWKVVTDELPRLKLAIQAIDTALEAEKKT